MDAEISEIMSKQKKAKHKHRQKKAEKRLIING